MIVTQTIAMIVTQTIALIVTQTERLSIPEPEIHQIFFNSNFSNKKLSLIYNIIKFNIIETNLDL